MQKVQLIRYKELETDLRQNGDIEHGMVGGRFHSGMHDNCTIFKSDVLAPVAPFVRPLFGIVHLVEPVRAGGEPTPVKNHPYRKVGIVNVVVERNTPHHN